MDLCLACVPAVAAVGVGYVIYKIIPWLSEKISTLFSNYFYKKIYITMSQNKMKFLNIIKYLSNCPKNVKTAIISINDLEYEIPLTEIKVESRLSIKAHTDNNFNVTFIELSYWKSKENISFADGFLKRFSMIEMKKE